MSDAWALFKGSGFSYDNADTAAFLEVINSAKAVMEKTNPSEEEMSGAAVCRGDRKTGAAAGCDGSAGCGRGKMRWITWEQRRIKKMKC